MDGRSILWILTVGLVLIQAPHSNAIPVRRNMNSNMNMNSNLMEPRLHRSARRLPLYDQDLEYISPHERTYPRNLPADGDSANVAAVATAAADATLSVTKDLAEDMGETAAVAVAEAVSRILGKPRRRPPVGRRSSNVNSNSNYNLFGRPSSTDSEDLEPILENVGYQSRNAPGIIQDFPGTSEKRYYVLPDRDSDRFKWKESRYGERERELSRSDPLGMSRCRYQPAVCGRRREAAIGKMELMDDHASDPTEEITTKDPLGEAGGLDGDKEFPDDEKDDNFLNDELLSSQANATSTPKPARRARNRNQNHNPNRESRRFSVGVRIRTTRRPSL